MTAGSFDPSASRKRGRLALLMPLAVVIVAIIGWLNADPECWQTSEGLCCSGRYLQIGHPDFQKPGGPERLEDLLPDRRTGRYEIVSRSNEAATVHFYNGSHLVGISTYHYNKGWQWAGGRSCGGEWP